MTRLHSEALKGGNSFIVETGMDLVEGDRLALLPTSFDNMASDDVFVKSYDTATGKVTITSTLLWYHWGAINS